MNDSQVRNLRPLLAALAFLAYVAAITWHNYAYPSTWRTEQSGALLFATSYLFYGKQFGSIDSGLWESFLKNTASANPSDEESADLFLANAADRKIPAGGLIASMLDGNGVGYAYFATVSLFLFGPHTLSLVLGFAIVLSISVIAFLLRFSDDQILVVPVLFLALTLMLLTPHATIQFWIDQNPIGGDRYFIIAGVLPTFHIILELFDSWKRSATRARHALLGLQFAVLLFVTGVRMSAICFVGAIAFAAMLSLWIRRRDRARRSVIVIKVAVLLIVAIVAQLAGRFLTPSAYREAGLTSEVFWHRAFIGFAAHPAWPFGNLAATFPCQPEIPEGLTSSGGDRNGHCAYFAALKKGGAPSPLYGTEYESLLRQAYWDVVRQYPGQVIETYLIYKPLLIWNTLRVSTQLRVSRETVPALLALAVQVGILMIMLCGGIFPSQAGEHWEEDAGDLRVVCGAFALIGAFAMAPQLFAWSSIATSSDVVCYMYVALIVLPAAAVRYWQRRYTSLAAPKRGHNDSPPMA